MAPLKLVYASASVDEAFRVRLASHLQPLVQQGLFTSWDEQLIPPGAHVEQERLHAWLTADILLVLVSPNYFDAPTYDELMMQEALERQRLNQLLIVPVLVSSFTWQLTSLAHLQPLPRNRRPVALWEHEDEALETITQELCQLVKPRGPAPMPLSSLQRTNRQRLLKQVRVTWIEGWLKRSLHQAIWVDLHLQEQRDALENPWRLVVQELQHEPRPLPPGTSIIQVFDDADEELLILGDAGAGKTTLLLYLARTLLDRAEADERRRIPVVFQLSSWGQQRQPLERWLVEELKTKYQVAEQIGRAWIEADQIFPLLDGLDEVVESCRAECAKAIIAYIQRSANRTPLVICCRNEAYRTLAIQFPLQYAVLLLPFTNDQIDRYLSSVSGQLDALRRALSEDQDLFELARRPLLLSVFALAYQGASVVDLPTPATRQEYPQALFKQYVKRMLTRRTHLHLGTEEQARRWLSYLARQLQLQQQTIFTVESLQPAWLPERVRPWYSGAMVLVYGLVFSVVFGLIFALAFDCAYGLLYHTIARLVFGLMLGLSVGLIGGLVGGLIFGFIFRHHQEIRPAEVTAWSWSSVLKGALSGLLGGLVVGLAGGIPGALVAGPVGGIALGSVATLLVTLVGALVGGSTPTQLTERAALTPNAGIWRSGRRGLLLVLCCIILFGLAGGLLVGLFGAAIVSIAEGTLLGLALGAAGGLVFGVAFGLVGGRTGIAAFIQHFVLRFFLWRLQLLPWNLVAFLDEACDRLLLRKVGGNYIFVHRLLRDTLATQNSDG